MTDTIAMPDQTEEVAEGRELVDFMTRRARTYGASSVLRSTASSSRSCAT